MGVTDWTRVIVLLPPVPQGYLGLSPIRSKVANRFSVLFPAMPALACRSKAIRSLLSRLHC